jgi:hypothetical protein
MSANYKCSRDDFVLQTSSVIYNVPVIDFKLFSFEKNTKVAGLFCART